MHLQSSERSHARVLVVEDNFDVASLLVDALTDEGYLTGAVSTGAEAIESLREYRPDAIVLDLMMPDMDGWDFIEHYRDVTGGDPIPIFVVSAAGAIAKSAHELGVRAFFRKPFDLAALLTAIQEVA